MARKIVITSGKGGVGKTSFTVNIASRLASLNKKVIMLDLDLGLNNLDVLSGIENKIVYDIVDVVENKCRLKQAIVELDGSGNLAVLPSSQSYGRHLVTAEKLKHITNALSEMYDYILIDSPAGIEDGFYKAAEVCTEAIIVTTPHLSAIRDAGRVLNILKSLNVTSVKFVLNRVRGDLVLDNEMLSPEAVKSFIKCPLLAVLPESDEVSISSNTGRIASMGEIEKAFKIAARNIEFGEENIYDTVAKYRGIFGSFKKRRII